MLDKCYVSCLTNDRDIKGVLTINYQLVKHNCEYPFFCLCTKDVSTQSRDILNNSNIFIIDVDFHNHLKSFNIQEYKINNLYTASYYVIFFIFLIKVQKIVYLDAGVLILQNIDHLFNKDTSHNTMFMSNDLHMVQTETANTSTNTSNKQFTLINDLNKFNSGVIICEPNSVLFDQLINHIKISSLEDIQNWHSDHTLFNLFHEQHIIHIHALDHIYNMIFNSIHFFVNNNIVKEEDIHIIHYTLLPKPWSNNAYNKACRDIEKKYWIQWYKAYTGFVEDNIRPSYIQLTAVSGLTI